uniref:HDC05937 n=1 Tax=Drosophila melanogaster TaxID=7227 RepID=Q6IGL7_DROME|nr:TPA_inf: HDC05937 [Drosophila melanogaster]
MYLILKTLCQASVAVALKARPGAWRNLGGAAPEPGHLPCSWSISVSAEHPGACYTDANSVTLLAKSSACNSAGLYLAKLGQQQFVPPHPPSTMIYIATSSLPDIAAFGATVVSAPAFHNGGPCLWLWLLLNASIGQLGSPARN